MGQPLSSGLFSLSHPLRNPSQPQSFRPGATSKLCHPSPPQSLGHLVLLRLSLAKWASQCYHWLHVKSRSCHTWQALTMTRVIHSLIQAFSRHLRSIGAGETGARWERALGAWVGQETSAINHPSALITAVISSLRTSSGHCGLRSGSARPPSKPLVGRGPSSVSHASCSESAPCPHVSRTPASGQSSLKGLDDKEAACPLRSLLRRGEIGEEEGRGESAGFPPPPRDLKAVPLAGSLWTFYKWGLCAQLSCNLFRTWDLSPYPRRAPALTFNGLP